MASGSFLAAHLVDFASSAITDRSPARHHQRAPLGVGRQTAVESIEVQPWPAHLRRQPLHELRRRHDQVRRAVAPRAPELKKELVSGVGLRANFGQCREVDIAKQMLQCLAVMGAIAHGGVQAEAVGVGAQRLLEVKSTAP